jgi:hypothetical protein
MAALGHRELLSQGKILQQEAPTRTKQAKDRT